MKIVYFDICAVILFLMILFVCYSRKMTKGNANRLFILLVFISLFTTVADLGMEIADNHVPLSEAGRILCCVSTYIYMILRNANNAVLLLFLLALTRTAFLIRKKWVRVLFCLPYVCVLVMLAQNLFTHSAFTVTAEVGYSRGPLMMAFYGIALLCGIAGLAYCIYCRRYLPADKWVALLSIYVLVHLAVLFQFFRPDILLEMFMTAVGEMLIMLSVIRPEERMDSEVGMLSWVSYQTDLRNILRSGNHVQIIVIRMLNCREIRNYLGDHRYNSYLSEIADRIRGVSRNDRHNTEIYFERPGTIYLITDELQTDRENVGERLLSEAADQIRQYADMGVRFEPRVCLIRCPDDLNSVKGILSLGHTFHKSSNRNGKAFRAAEIVNSRDFTIEAHIDEILDRAIRENRVEMHYQPIFDVRAGRFRSAEALARINDPEFGTVSPAVFIPAAETLGYILPLGNAVLDHVFRFVSEHKPEETGLDYIEINLSVAQCMESSLPAKIRELQCKYGVDPRNVYFEITETTFENISDTVYENVNELIRMGYSFALDDFGIGYSSIQRVNRLPLQLIKVDKSMLDEASTENGHKILEYTVRMMQSIGKQLVVEGAETREAVEILESIRCDYIQGFYYSRPLPEAEFIQFIKAEKGKTP